MKAVWLAAVATAAAVSLAAAGTASQTAPLSADLDRIFNDPVLARALIGVRVESLRDGQVL